MKIKPQKKKPSTDHCRTFESVTLSGSSERDVLNYGSTIILTVVNKPECCGSKLVINVDYRLGKPIINLHGIGV